MAVGGAQLEDGANDFGGRCRVVDRGMCDREGGGWCGWGVDYLTISRPRSKKKGRWRGGGAARRRVASEEASCKKKGHRRGG